MKLVYVKCILCLQVTAHDVDLGRFRTVTINAEASEASNTDIFSRMTN